MTPFAVARDRRLVFALLPPVLSVLVPGATGRARAGEAGAAPRPETPVCRAEGSCRTGEVVLPAPLRGRAAPPELSGLAWSEALGRYLTVVDEPIPLGRRGDPAAVVFALDPAGALDPEPVPLVGPGAGEIDDAEALTPGREGTFFLLTSHAPTRRGNLRRERRQLLELVLEGRRLRITGSLDLLTGKGGIDRQLEALGFPKGTAVDFEGVAYRDGTLYLGLKSPLSREGAAMIFQIDDPGAALARDKVKKRTLELWGEVRLGGRGPLGEEVPQGIADLAFGPDGALYLCANAPKDGTPDGGGTFWRIAEPKGGRMEAKLLRRFPGLKPEGVAAGAGGRGLTVVFDRDAGAPLWTTWPLEGKTAPHPASPRKRGEEAEKAPLSGSGSGP